MSKVNNNLFSLFIFKSCTNKSKMAGIVSLEDMLTKLNVLYLHRKFTDSFISNSIYFQEVLSELKEENESRLICRKGSWKMVTCPTFFVL